jgi:hypothetical protein
MASSPLRDPVNPTDPPQLVSHRSWAFHAVLVIFLGLAAAQIIASVHVYLSNLALYDRMQTFKDAGYLIVPNSNILPCLLELKPAVFGGIFFTLSAGAFLTLFSVMGAWLWCRPLLRKKALLPVLLIPWLSCVFALNLPGFSLMPTLYFLVIPSFVFTLASKWLFPCSLAGFARRSFLHALAPLFLALLWSTQMSGSFFVEIRDYLLLTHSAGSKVNDFYYRYTLYPAEILKSLDQKLLRSVYYGRMQDRALSQVLQRELLKHDYLPVQDETLADLVFKDEKRELHLQKQGITVLRINARQFTSSPGAWLAAFSKETDRGRFFRKVILISFLIGFPMLLYLLVYGILFLFISTVFPPEKSSVPATLLCVVAGILLFLLFVLGRATIHDEGQVDRALQSSDWRERVAALRFIHDNRLEAARHPAYRALLVSPFIPERHLLAKTLGVSRQAHTFKDILFLLDDENTTVVSAAFRAVGSRKDPAGIAHILTRITTSKDWYNQWNAYRALRNLGWKQSPSP